jgi:hypothetical protein
MACTSATSELFLDDMTCEGQNSSYGNVNLYNDRENTPNNNIKIICNPQQNKIKVSGNQTAEPIKFFYHNCSGLRTKLSKFYLDVKSCHFKVFILVETWLNDSFNDSEIFDDDWLVYRKDRNYQITNTSRGGGVLIAIHKSLNSSLLEFTSNTNSDQVWAKIIFEDRLILVGSCYIPPSSDITAYQDIFRNINTFCEQMNENDEILVFGDFNRPNLEFSKNVSDKNDENPIILWPNNISDDIDYELVECFYSNDIYQISDIKNSRNVQLDLIFSSILNDINVSEPTNEEKILVNSLHHSALILTLDTSHINYQKLNQNKIYQYDFKNSNFETLNNAFFNIDWENICSNSNLDQITEQFASIVNNIIEKNVPKKLKRDKTNEPWLTKELKNLRNKRNKAHKLLKNYNTTSNVEKHQKLFKEFEEKSCLAYDSYIKNIGNRIIDNPKEFHQYVSSKRKTNGFPKTMHLDEMTSDDPRHISYLFASKFKKTYTSDTDSTVLPNFDHILPIVSVSDIYLSDEDVFNGLYNLDIHKGAGPDKIPPIFLSNCAESLTKPLSLVFNRSLATGTFPSLWKMSFLTPIFKSGSKSDINNYRGIAKLSSIPKLFEKLVCDKLLDVIPPQYHEQQHGFVKNRSITSNIMIYINFIYKAFERKEQVDAAYTDFSKAFDTVNHRILIKKLESLGFSGNILNWIASYLTDRTQIVRFLDNLSEPVQVTSGVPQGSHLGPLLFNLFISDLSIVLGDINHLFYADDLKIFHEIKSDSDAEYFQEKLCKLKSWCDDNLLHLNVAKCHIITFTRRLTRHVFTYKIGTDEVERVNTITDLGILLDEKLTYKPHCDKLIAKANGLLGFIKRRAKEFNNTWVTKKLYLTYVRTILEFGSVIWMPYTDEYIVKLESIQKKFLLFALRHIYDPRNFRLLPSYENRLSILELEKLSTRREHASSIFIFNILNGGIKSLDLSNYVTINQNRQTRFTRHLNEYSSTKDYILNAPLNRGIRLFNSFISCYDKENFMSVDNYRSKLKRL